MESNLARFIGLRIWEVKKNTRSSCGETVDVLKTVSPTRQPWEKLSHGDISLLLTALRAVPEMECLVEAVWEILHHFTTILPGLLPRIVNPAANTTRVLIQQKSLLTDFRAEDLWL